MSNDFEDFPVYQKALNFVREINLLCKTSETAQFLFLKDQIRRASTSILLNIAEGSAKWNKKDKTNFYRIGLASATECVAAIDIFLAYDLIGNFQASELKADLKDVTNGLQALIFYVNKRAK